MTKLVEEGAWVDFRRGDETTPLMCYSESGDLDLVLELLGWNANVDLQDKVLQPPSPFSSLPWEGGLGSMISWFDKFNNAAYNFSPMTTTSF